MLCVWIRLCFSRKAFLKKFAGHFAQLYWGFRTRETAMWSFLRWDNRRSFTANLKIGY